MKKRKKTNSSRAKRAKKQTKRAIARHKKMANRQIVRRHGGAAAVGGMGILQNQGVQRLMARGARAVGEYAGQRLRQAYQNYQDTPPSTPRMDDFDDENEEAMAGLQGGGTGGGVAAFRGPLTGNTMEDRGYADHFLELNDALNSRKVWIRETWWGINTIQNAALGLGTSIQDPNLGIGINFAQTNLLAPTALISQGYWMKGDPYFLQAGTIVQRVRGSYSDYVQPAVFNFYMSDLIDNKVLGLNTNTVPATIAGIGSQYNKFRLTHFTIDITPTTYNMQINANAPKGQVANNIEDTDPTIVTSGTAAWCCEKSMGTDYWFYRDTYGKFGNVSTPLPLDVNATTPAVGSINRTCSTLRNMDQFVTIIKSDEKFSIHRKVNQKASYYLNTQDLLALSDNSSTVTVAAFLAELEGLNTGTTIAKPLPEGFTILAVPTYTPHGWVSQPGVTTPSSTIPPKPMVASYIKTVFHVKVTAKWEGYDFNYTGTAPIAFESNSCYNIQANMERFNEQ